MIYPPFFPRGPGPLASFLLPTRGNPHEAIASMCSVMEKSSRQGIVEFLLKVDEDDTESVGILKECSSWMPIKMLVTPRGNGYADMHHYCNALAEMATGDWLVLWDDDFFMTTPCWDLVMEYTRPIPAFPWSQEIMLMSTSGSDNTLSALRWSTYKLLGHISCSFVCDAWVHRLMQICEAVIRVPITVNHDRHIKVDAVHLGRDDAYWKHENLKPEVKRQYARDIETLVNYQEKKEREAVWQDRPERIGWHIWKVPDEFPTSIYLDGSVDSRWIIQHEPPYPSYVINGIGEIATTGDTDIYGPKRWHRLELQ